MLNCCVQPSTGISESILNIRLLCHNFGDQRNLHGIQSSTFSMNFLHRSVCQHLPSMIVFRRTAPFRKRKYNRRFETTCTLLLQSRRHRVSTKRRQLLRDGCLYSLLNVYRKFVRVVSSQTIFKTVLNQQLVRQPASPSNQQKWLKRGNVFCLTLM